MQYFQRLYCIFVRSFKCFGILRNVYGEVFVFIGRVKIFRSDFSVIVRSERGSGWEEIERNFEENDVWKGNFCRGKSEMSEVEKQSRSRHVTGCGVER